MARISLFRNNYRQEYGDMVKCLLDDIKQFGDGAELILLGHINGHIEGVD